MTNTGQSADDVSCGLLKSGVSKGDNIASISNNRPEWNFVDMGILQIGAVHVPISQNISDEDLVYILNETESKIIFVANNFLFKKVNTLLPKIKSIQKIYTFDNVAKGENYEELLKLGKSCDVKSNLESIRNSIMPEDIATIIYTSGIPKGVMLSHHNIVSNFVAYSKTLNLDYSHIAFSYLPLCHALERMINYQYQYLGITIYYAQSFAGIISNLREVKPTVFSTVPLLLDKVYDSIIENGNTLKGLNKKLFKWATYLTSKYDLNQQHSLAYRIQLKLANNIFKKWREIFGGKLELIICGGAALQAKILKVYWAAGLPVYEGYGLTETSPVISNNNYNIYKLGTVGKILNGVQVRIADDGEVLCKGPNVMIGYLGSPD